MHSAPKIITSLVLGGVLITTAACSSSGGGTKNSEAPPASAPASSSSPAKDTSPVATIATLTGNSTSVALDAGFIKALGTLKLTPGLEGKATMPTPGTLTFPITGGHVTVYKKGQVSPYVQGELDHYGSGFTLTSGKTVVTLENFIIDPGSPATLKGKVLLNGKVAAPVATLFNLDGSTLKPITIDPTTKVATLTGTRVKISSAAAGLLNMVFKTTAVKAGTLVGIATILAK